MRSVARDGAVCVLPEGMDLTGFSGTHAARTRCHISRTCRSPASLSNYRGHVVGLSSSRLGLLVLRAALTGSANPACRISCPSTSGDTIDRSLRAGFWRGVRSKSDSWRIGPTCEGCWVKVGSVTYSSVRQGAGSGGGGGAGFGGVFTVIGPDGTVNGWFTTGAGVGLIAA